MTYLMLFFLLVFVLIAIHLALDKTHFKNKSTGARNHCPHMTESSFLLPWKRQVKQQSEQALLKYLF